MPQGTFPISMDRSARYVTQSSAYDRLLSGPVLTDRRIAQLQKQGFYRSGLVLPPVAGRTKRRSAQRLTAAELMKRYNI